MKIVILGAGGQLGRQLCKTLPGEIAALTRAEADLTKPSELRQSLKQLRPRVVVNAAAYTQVDSAEAEPQMAFAINAIGVRDLAIICRDLDCTLIHFSSDYVFGQDVFRSAAYGETDVPGPLNVYGASKLAGEQFVQSICPRHFILRTCGLYGEGSNFVATMLRLAGAGQPIRVVNDQTCTPTSAVDLAQATRELLDSDGFGLYHVTNAGACTWHEFAETILEMTHQTVELLPIGSKDYAAAAQRPRYSVLSNARWLDRGFTALPSWEAALERHLARGQGKLQASS